MVWQRNLLSWLRWILFGALVLFITSTRAFSVVPITTSSSSNGGIIATRLPLLPSSVPVSFIGRTVPLLAKKKKDDDDDDDDDIVEETLDEDEFEEWEEEDYEENEDEDWDDDEDFQLYELEEDTSDPNYMKQKQLVEEQMQARKRHEEEENFDALDYIMNSMTDEEMVKMEELPMQKEVEARVQGMELTEEDLKGIETMKKLQKKVDATSDILDDPPYPIYEEGEENILEEDIQMSNDDMVDLENAWKMAKTTIETPSWDKVVAKDEDPLSWASLSNETLEEMEACLEEVGGSSYNVTRFLLYDLDFNVTNLMLAAVKHNRKAPILFQHWYPQLLTYKRYKNASDRDFDFTWQDVENADLSELEEYYKGMGYDEIPTKAPAETGIISLEDLDEEEIRMAALENWMTDVYNPEWDRKDFDDDDMRDEDNVFSEYYEAPQHPDLPSYEDTQEDLDEWDEEMDEENEEHKKYMGEETKYEVVVDEDFQREFRGHLVVCCTMEDSDLEIAEKITKRMEEEFGKQVFVETRVIAHAREEDNVFEVWLESYEVDLLHSKRRASMNTKGWDGPAECDDKEIEWLVGKVGFLISDDSRYSYRYDFEMAD